MERHFQSVVQSVMAQPLQGLFAKWKGLAGQEGRLLSLPRLLEAFSDELDFLVVAEPREKSFLYQHYGQQFVNLFGVDLNGERLEYLDQNILQDYRRFIVEFEYSYVLHHGVPVWRSYTAEFVDGSQTWQRLILPINGRWVLMGAVQIESGTEKQSDAAELLNMVLESTPVRLDSDMAVSGLAISVDNVSGWRIREEEMEKLATTDALTGLHNRRYFHQAATAELHRALRYEHGLALLLLDIDHFKKVNDTHGHSVGDEALIHIAELLPDVLRASDHLARLGGEEFVILLPEVNMQGALAVAEKIRTFLETTPCDSSIGPLSLTVSIGGTMADAETDAALVLERADRALYRAKDEGRNRVYFVE